MTFISPHTVVLFSACCLNNTYITKIIFRFLSDNSVIYDIVGPPFCICVYWYLTSIYNKMTFISPHMVVLFSACCLTYTYITQIIFRFWSDDSVHKGIYDSYQIRGNIVSLIQLEAVHLYSCCNTNNYGHFHETEYKQISTMLLA